MRLHEKVCIWDTGLDVDIGVNQVMHDWVHVRLRPGDSPKSSASQEGISGGWLGHLMVQHAVQEGA